MKQLVNLVDNIEMLSPLADESGLDRYIRSCGCDGAEIIHCAPGAAGIITQRAVIGYHLMFYPDWLGFYKSDEAYIMRHFGSWDTAYGYYRCKTPDEYVEMLRADMDRAESFNAEYAVFHVSDVSSTEVLNRRWEHTNAEIIDCSAELLNAAMRGRNYSFRLLLENLAMPGMTLTDPHETERMLSLVEYRNTGLMLDTGHLMGTNLSLKSEHEAFSYVLDTVKRHGDISKRIYGIHLHQSITGSTVLKMLAENITPKKDFYDRYVQSYGWVQKIDRHLPVNTHFARELIGYVSPQYLVHELSAPDLGTKRDLIEAQRSALSI